MMFRLIWPSFSGIVCAAVGAIFVAPYFGGSPISTGIAGYLIGNLAARNSKKNSKISSLSAPQSSNPRSRQTLRRCGSCGYHWFDWPENPIGDCPKCGE